MVRCLGSRFSHSPHFAYRPPVCPILVSGEEAKRKRSDANKDIVTPKNPRFRMNRGKLHEQARRAIERLIVNRGIKAGSRIPTESKLAGEFYVSRTTIRRALKDLEQEGKIEYALGGMIVAQQTTPKKVQKQGCARASRSKV